MEEIIARLSTRQPPVEDLTSGLTPAAAGRPWAPAQLGQMNIVTGQGQGQFASSVTGESPSIVSAPDPVDGMGAVLLGNEEVLTYFGNSARSACRGVQADLHRKDPRRTLPSLATSRRWWLGSVTSRILGRPRSKTKDCPF
jgi:hypothetical protein